MWAPLRGMSLARSFQIFSENPCKGIKKKNKNEEKQENLSYSNFIK